METQQQQKNRENYVENQTGGGEEQLRQKIKDGKASKQSSPTSPSHEFSFSISLHSNKSRALPSLVVDLSPADEIFFHGHLLPLHLLSHLTASSPRSSTNSMDNVTLPIKELLQDEKPFKDSLSPNCSSNKEEVINGGSGTKGESKSRTFFSLFGLTRGHKRCQLRDGEEAKEKHKRKKLRFDVIHALKRYLGKVQSLMLFRGRREKIGFHGKPYSYASGNLSLRDKQELMRSSTGQYYSAPASRRSSPTNSGLLLPTKFLPPANDSTMEELEAAIQAAIAHCKNSCAKEDKLKC